MTFDYNSLKKAAKDGVKLGNWKDLPVFAICENDMERKGNGAYYIVYDNGNRLVKKIADTWFCYGTINKNGIVTEVKPQEYFVNTYVKEKKSPQTIPYETSGPDIDVKLELDVDATLKKARDLTVDDLLKGFNYGL